MNFKRIILFLFLILCTTLYSEIYIVKSFEYESFDQIINGIRTGLQKKKIQTFTLNKEILSIEDTAENVCFTLGEKAYIHIKEHTSKIKIIALMVINQALYINNKRTIFISSEMDLFRKAILLKKIITNMRGIIIPCSKEWYEKNHDEYIKKLSLKGLDLKFAVMDTDIGIYFEKMNIPEGYVVMAVYDVKIYNQTSIFNIFRIIYKKHIPFIGFSMGFIKNGCFIAILPDYYAMGIFSGKTLLGAKESKIEYLLENPAYSVLINGNIMEEYDFTLNLTYGDIKVIK